MADFFTPTVLACIATALFAGVLRGATGFGSALVMAPVLSVFLGPQTGVPLTILLGLTGSVFLFPHYRTTIQYSVVGTMAVIGLFFILPGVWLLNLIDANTMRRIIAALVFTIAGSMLVFRNFSFEAQSKAVDRIGITIASALGGLIMGATGMGGLPLVTYLAGRTGTAQQKKANILFTVGALEIGTILIMVLANFFNIQTLILSAVLIAPFGFGLWLGEHWFRTKLSHIYQMILIVTLMATGLFVALF
ncbi:MAG: sulfite exporter TauE/SafE family protein [Xanthobacteraceae bacterium]|nr:sulfite exporter TauE/SafE family protein [Xanthobacteraceae bacterium]MBX3519577.1 sulfite exporter TauE/SafE family protein [Xanthobacteraceae bacterium]MBX3549247.1 sulfite exporter TauE/SafE family protein [Xanthobacteraceae bacterium]